MRTRGVGPGLAGVATITLALFGGCNDGGDAGPSSSSSSSAGAPEPTSSTPMPAPSHGSTSSSSSSSSTGGLPPGCTDNAHAVTILRVDASHLRIASLEGASCTGAGKAPALCDAEYFDAVLTVPTGVTKGTWTLPSAEVSLTITKDYPMQFSAAGCKCLAPILTPQKVDSGTITLAELDAGAGVIELSIPRLGLGKLSSLVQACP